MKTGWAVLCLGLTLGLPVSAQGPNLEPVAAAAPKREAAREPKLMLSDGKLPLWEMRPLDRRVYVISLDGVWKKPPEEGASYQLTIRFPGGRTYSHRPINDPLFAR